MSMNTAPNTGQGIIGPRVKVGDGISSGEVAN